MISGTPGGCPVSACMPVGAEQDALAAGFGAAGAVPSEELSALGVPGVPSAELGAFGVAGVPGVALGVSGAAGAGLGVLGSAGVPGIVTGARLEGGAAPSPTSGSMNAPGVGAGTPAGPTIASSCPLVNLMR